MRVYETKQNEMILYLLSQQFYIILNYSTVDLDPDIDIDNKCFQFYNFIILQVLISTANEVPLLQLSRFTNNLLSDLTDFSNVAISSRYSCIQKPTTALNINSPRDCSYLQMQQLDLNNQSRLLDQFRRLRQKLREETKRCSDTKREWLKCQKKYEEKICKLQNKQRDNQSAMRFLKKEVQIINEGIDKLKRRNTELQKEIIIKEKYQNEINRLLSEVDKLQKQKEGLREEKNKTQEILLLEKLEVQEKLNQYYAFERGQKSINKEFQGALIQSRELNITLESKIKRIKDQFYLKDIQRSKELRENSNKCDELLKENQGLKKQIEYFRNKYEGQKARRKKQDDQEVRKIEINSLYCLQNQVQEKELNQLRKRVEKLSDRYEIKALQAQCEAFKSMETLAKLWKSVDIVEELIHRLKRQGGMKEDIDKLIKVSEYKINKIKQSQNKSQKQSLKSSNHSSITNLLSKRKSQSKSLSKSKSHSKSRSKSPSCYTAQKSPQQSSLKDEFISYTTPKLREISISDPSDPLAVTNQKTLQQKIRTQLKDKQKQLKNQLQFQKYNKLNFHKKREF